MRELMKEVGALIDTLAKGSALPLFDSLEHVIVRVADRIHSMLESKWGPHKSSVLSLLDGLLRMYVSNALDFCERLGAVQRDLFSLALATAGEPVGYPIRTLRILAYIAVAILVSVDLVDQASATQAAVLTGEAVQ
jgi:hypothetical protein